MNKFFLAFPLFSLISLGVGGADAIPTGLWQGGGRACTGTLKITAKKLAWKSSFNRCKSVAYKAESFNLKDNVQKTLFMISSQSAGCAFSVIELRETQTPGRESLWEAIGYPNRLAWQSQDMEHALGCPLVRLK